MILRDFDYEALLRRGEHIKTEAEKLQNKYQKARIKVDIKEQYFNMLPYVQKDPRPLEKATKALSNNEISPKNTKIRGGTDGATFSKMGLPTPNLGTGSANHHGRFEYLVVQDFLKMIDIVVDIMKID